MIRTSSGVALSIVATTISSYRLKDKLKARLVRPAQGPGVNPGGGDFSVPVAGDDYS
jgi:hypothetical protein